jgi:hypothetical protein
MSSIAGKESRRIVLLSREETRIHPKIKGGDFFLYAISFIINLYLIALFKASQLIGC